MRTGAGVVEGAIDGRVTSDFRLAQRRKFWEGGGPRSIIETEK